MAESSPNIFPTRNAYPSSLGRALWLLSHLNDKAGLQYRRIVNGKLEQDIQRESLSPDSVSRFVSKMFRKKEDLRVSMAYYPDRDNKGLSLVYFAITTPERIERAEVYWVN